MNKEPKGIKLCIEYSVNPKFRNDMEAVLIELENEISYMVENKFKDKLVFLSGEGDYIK